MKISVDLSGLEYEVKQSKKFPRLLKEGLIEVVAVASKRTMGKVKAVMPVDTGFARAIWGMFTPEHIVNHLKLAQSARLGESIWRVKNGGLTIEQGAAITPRNYIELLNAGTSNQAPMMFLDTIAGQEEAAMQADAMRLIEEIF